MRKLYVSSASFMGPVRQNNEDMCLVRDVFIRDDIYEADVEMDNRSFWIAVSDGMGGHRAGELASEFVLRRMCGWYPDHTEVSIHSQISGHIREVHHALNRMGKENPALKGLGCTFTGLLIHAGNVFLIHIGDSRLYRYRPPYLSLLTRDHTVRNLWNDPSAPPNQLLNCFGGGAEDISFDFEDLTDRFSYGDVYLICTDGLNGELTDEQIEALVSTGCHASELVSQAIAAGGRDNISCILLNHYPVN